MTECIHSVWTARAVLTQGSPAASPQPTPQLVSPATWPPHTSGPLQFSAQCRQLKLTHPASPHIRPKQGVATPPAAQNASSARAGQLEHWPSTCIPE